MNFFYLYGSVIWRSWTVWTFLRDGNVVVDDDWGVHDTELAFDGVLLTLTLGDVSSSDPVHDGGHDDFFGGKLLSLDDDTCDDCELKEGWLWL